MFLLEDNSNTVNYFLIFLIEANAIQEISCRISVTNIDEDDNYYYLLFDMTDELNYILNDAD